MNATFHHCLPKYWFSGFRPTKGYGIEMRLFCTITVNLFFTQAKKKLFVCAKDLNTSCIIEIPIIMENKIYYSILYDATV